MAGEQAPADVAADFMKMLEGAQGGDPSEAASEQTVPTDAGEVEGSEFQDQPTDTPDVTALKRQLRQTMTKRTTEIAQERRKLQEQSKAYEQAIRDAETLRALKEARDPAKAVEALFGSNGGGVSQAPSVEAYKEKFDAPTYEAILGLVNAAWLQNAKQHLSPYQQALHQLVNDRTSSEVDRAIAEFGDDAGRWKDEALKLQQQTGLPFKKALLAVSDGQVALSKLRSAYLDKKKRETTQASVSEQTVSPNKIRLTREQRNAELLRRAQELGVDQFARP